MFLEIDGTIWIQLLNFAIFFAILNVIFLRPVGEAIRKRREYIDGVLSDTERYEREAKIFRNDAEAKRAEARREASERIQRSRSQAIVEATELSGEYVAKAASIAEGARITVQEEMRQAREREAELAETLARTLLDRAVGAVTR